MRSGILAPHDPPPSADSTNFVDPAFAPGTRTPEVGGPSSGEAMAYERALRQIDFRGFDCVEVLPSYDPTQITPWVAASACHEMLSLAALRSDR